MRKPFIALLAAFLFLLFYTTTVTPLPTATYTRDYYITNFLSDTGALNSVTAIYLNYRVFDTMFESLLLLISVIGIIYFSRHKGDY